MSSPENDVAKRSIRVRTWEEFKKLALEKQPKNIVYVIARSIPAKNLTSLKLIMPIESAQYIFVDSAKGDTLRRTGIAIHCNEEGTRFLKEQDVEKFLEKHLGRGNLQVLSYWTI